MNHNSTFRLLVRLGFCAVALVAVGMISFSSARQDTAKTRPKTEYLSQEVHADAMAPTLNDIDAQGWDVFQVVPIWKIQGGGGDSSLVPKAYQVFGRRTVANKS